MKTFEDFTQSGNFKLRSMMVELQKNIHSWFQDGSLSKEKEIQDYDVEIGSSTRGLNKNLILNFNDNLNKYQIIFVMSLDQVKEDKIDKCFIEVKKYDMDKINLIRTLNKTIDIKDINEDFIVGLISELDDESTSENPDVISDEEAKLDDTTVD